MDKTTTATAATTGTQQPMGWGDWLGSFIWSKKAAETMADKAAEGQKVSTVAVGTDTEPAAKDAGQVDINKADVMKREVEEAKKKVAENSEALLELASAAATELERKDVRDMNEGGLNQLMAATDKVIGEMEQKTRLDDLKAELEEKLKYNKTELGWLKQALEAYRNGLTDKNEAAKVGEKFLALVKVVEVHKHNIQKDDLRMLESQCVKLKSRVENLCTVLGDHSFTESNKCLSNMINEKGRK